VRAPQLTSAEAKVVHDLLRTVWIPNAGYTEFKSALKKLEELSRVPEEHPYSNRGSDCGN
jgi:hypothetical protein